MGAWWRIRSLAPLRQVQVSSRVVLGIFGAGREWGRLDDGSGGDLPLGSCRGYFSVSGPLQSVQRAEL